MTNGSAGVRLGAGGPSYLAGTRIRTDRAEVAIEHLRIGDKVATLDGTAKPVVWIGRRAHPAVLAAGNPDLVPIRIAQGAIGRNVPHRDLFVSPSQALFFDDILIPAGYLENGESIVRCPRIDPIRYFHIELDRHDIIFAEGAPAETFVDCDNRGMFHNASEYAERYPAGQPQRWLFCAPRVETGAVLDQVRRVIDGRAGLVSAGAEVSPGPLEGNVDGLDGNTITGWAFDPAHPASSVLLEVLDGDLFVARLTANRFRGDLAAAGIGDGRHGFELPLSRSLSPLVRHDLRIRRVSDGRELAGSPLTIEPHDRRSLVRDTRRAIELAANTASDPGTLDALLETLLLGVDRVRRLHATREHEQQSPRPAGGPRQPRPKRVLAIDDLIPRRDRDAGSNAILSHMAALRSLGWSIEFVASGQLSGGDDAAAALAESGAICHRSPRVASVEEVMRRNRNMYDLVYLHRLSNAEAYAPLARMWQPKARIVYSIADLHHVRSARQAAVHGNAELAEAAVYLKARELNAMRMADAVITHSLAEADYIRREEPVANVHVVPWALHPAPRTLPLRKRNGIAFVGGMRHAPNPDAVRWLAAEILPRVWARDPTMQCLLVGADWPEPVWGRIDPRLRLTGPVGHLDEVFDRIRLTVAPLRFGAGIKGKVLDSFASGLPCVMTPIAAEGIPLGDVLRSAVASDPREMADLICDLHHQSGLNGKHARAGLALIKAGYTEDAIQAALEAVVGAGSGSRIPVRG
jgi:glycosyltransferase involved in cell wall biosynthesis